MDIDCGAILGASNGYERHVSRALRNANSLRHRVQRNRFHAPALNKENGKNILRVSVLCHAKS